MRIYDVLPPNATAESYFDIPRLSKSALDDFATDPMQYYLKKLDPNREPFDTKVFAFGRLAHCAQLEFHEMQNRYYLFDDVAKVAEIGGGNPRATNKYKDALIEAEWNAHQQGKVIIKSSDRDNVMAMREAMKNHPLATALLEHEGHVEYKVLWDAQHDFLERTVHMKSMLDKLIPNCEIPQYKGKSVVLDYKTTDDISRIGIAKSCHKYRYDIQNAMYLDAVGADVFIFIFQEKKYPYRVKTIELEQSRIETARLDYMDDIETALYHLDQWDATNDISAFYEKGFNEVQQITLPTWARL